MNSSIYSTGKLLNFDTATNSSARMMLTNSANPESLLEVLKENSKREQADKEKPEASEISKG